MIKTKQKSKICEMVALAKAKLEEAGEVTIVGEGKAAPKAVSIIEILKRDGTYTQENDIYFSEKSEPSITMTLKLQ
jgi:DNA-binding protein